MLQRFRNTSVYKNYREFLLCSLDLVIVTCAFIVSYWAKLNFSVKNFTYLHRFIAILLIYVVIHLISFILFKVYKSLWRYAGVNEIIRLTASMATAFFMMVIIVPFVRSGDLGYVISITLMAELLALFAMLSLRLLYRLIRTHETSGKKLDNTLIIGAGDGGYILLKEILQNPSLKINLIGFVDDLKNGKIISGKEVLGTTEDIPYLVDKYQIGTLYIAMPSASRDDLDRIITIAQKTKAKIKILREKLVVDSVGSKSKGLPVQDIAIEDLLGRGQIDLNGEEISSYLKNKVIMVTGAAGSIGSELVRQIVRFDPARLILVDVNENDLYMLEQEFNRNRVHGIMNPNIEVISIIASIVDERQMNDLMKEYKPSVVYHAAAHKHVPLMETIPSEAIKNNVFGTNNVINACIANHVERFIMISTDKAVNPTNVMGATKRMTEIILQSKADNGITKFAAVRFGNVLGSNGSVIPIFMKQIAQGGPVTITHRDIQRYFMTIPEAAQRVLQAGYYADKGEIFVLDMGKPVKIIDLAEKMIRMAGYIPNQDIMIKEIGLRPGEKMFEELKLSNEEVTKTANDLIFVNHPQDIQEGDVIRVLEELETATTLTNDRQKARDAIFQAIHTFDY